MRERIAWLLYTVMTVSSLTACDGGNSNTAVTTAAGAQTEDTKAADTTTIAQTEGEDIYTALRDFTITVEHAQSKDNPHSVSMEKFAADAAERTNGHMTVEVYGSRQLGTEKEMLEQIVAGTVQGMRNGQFGFNPRLLMFALPSLAQNRVQVTALLNSDLAKKACAEAESGTGTVIIGLCDADGYRQFSNSKCPITKPEDLKRLKIRTNGMNTIDKTFMALGATTATIPYSDLYMGSKTGVTDGQENPWVNVSGMKFYEMQKYFTEMNYQLHPDSFYINAVWWNSLPAEYQQIVRECSGEMCAYNDQLISENQEASKQVAIDAGCGVYGLTAEELKVFQGAVAVVYEQCVTGGILTAKELKEVQDIVANAK